MSTFVQVLAQSPLRVQVLSDSVFAGSGTPANYTFSRPDGIATPVTVSSVITISPTTLSLCLSTFLIEGVIYVLAHTGITGTQAFSFIVSPATKTPGNGPLDDPEAEAFGLDLDWLSSSLSKGDCPTIRGIECLRQDLITIAQTSPGELFHRPKDGGGLNEQVNGTSPPGIIQSRLRGQWLSDRRVKDAKPVVMVGTDGVTTISGTVTPFALNQQLPIQIPGG